MEIYDHKKIEKKWQDQWEKDELYKAPEQPTKKQYVLDMFPYVSGAGLHVGHPEGYTATDIYCRYLRANGFDVLHPMGWDAFGLPTENYAIKVGRNPKELAQENIATFKRQIKMFGFSYDWSREIDTSDPEYYKWTQWLFLQFYKKGLAYKKEASVNWCPKDQTVLANEQVVNGSCERCGTKVVQKFLSQWFFKITDYADRLLADLDALDWPLSIKQMQRNWIGRSEGAEIDFPVTYDEKTDFLILHGYKGLPGKNFIPWLKKALEDKGYAVQAPEMPNSDDPKEDEQVKYVLENSHIGPNTIIIAHSLGGVVAAKVLAKHGKAIRGLVLVAPAMDPSFSGATERPYQKNFKWDFDYGEITRLSGFRKVISDLKEKKRIPYLELLAQKFEARLTTGMADKEHFTSEQEPIILKEILPNIKTFTTRPDTLFGATYMVLAPEHPLVSQLTTKDQEKYVLAYVHKTEEKSELERTSLEKDKTGVFTGSYAINPATKEKVPIWIADYVLSTYGTGAIMAVPAHDKRDYEFAKKYELGIVRVVNDEGDRRLPYERDGRLMNSGKYNTVSSATARSSMIKEFGVPKVQYKIRDWLISRQRYWGAPIPIIYCDKCGIQSVPEKDLPVLLPDDVDFKPTGESPLSRSKKFNQVKCPNCTGEARRDHDTMDTFVDSSWYYFRFTDPHNTEAFANREKMKQWLPVDMYVGGAEHAVLHLLYARFFTKALGDLKYIDFHEPFLKLRNQGLILGPDGEKMSKSRGNVVNPDEVIEQSGADAFRMYEMFMGPIEDTKPWNTKGISGVRRFLDKVWREGQDFQEGEDNNHIHKLIEKITDDIQNFKFNTAIAAFMEFLNENKEMSRENWETFLVLLAPFAPHVTEELWHRQGNKDSIHKQSWPKYDERYVRDENVTVVVQVAGRLRASMKMPAGATQETVRGAALLDPNVKKHLEGKKIAKEIFVQDKLINFVLK